MGGERRVPDRRNARLAIGLVRCDDEQALNRFARRDKVLKLKDDLYGKASEAGKQMLDAATVPLKRFNDLEDQAGKLALLNSNNKAAEVWRGEGQPAAKDLDSIFDSMVAELNKDASESQRASGPCRSNRCR